VESVETTQPNAQVSQVVVESVIPGAVYGTPANPTARVSQVAVERVTRNPFPSIGDVEDMALRIHSYARNPHYDFDFEYWRD
ncbi:MAG: hypothetical protein Q7N50_14810, partial [Armatimonadota bacterium]|nr:hypothetical protein [Armatimonadota bacterium]